MNKKELITKIINNLKKFKKNKLIDIYNNYLIKNIKGGGHGLSVRNKPNKAVKVNSKPHYIQQIKTSPQNLFNFGNQTTQQPTDIFQYNPQERTEIFQSKVPFQQQPTDMNKKNVIVYEKKDKSKFDKFKNENIFYEEMYNKEVTYQHNYDSFRLFTILKHMFTMDKKKYLSDNLQIFQTIDAYYIRDVLEFVKNYFNNYKKNNIKFSYEIKKNKIFYRLNQHFGIMIYNKPFNTLDIYLKKTNTNTNQPQQQVQQQPQQQPPQQPRQVTPKPTILPNQTVNRDALYVNKQSRRVLNFTGKREINSA